MFYHTLNFACGLTFSDDFETKETRKKILLWQFESLWELQIFVLNLLNISFIFNEPQ